MNKTNENTTRLDAAILNEAADEQEGRYRALQLKPHIAVIDGEITTTSMALAEAFGKTHFHVLRKIKEAIENAPTQEHKSNFGFMLRDVALGQGATRRDHYYRLNKKSFSFIAFGFTGERARNWQWAYIYAFERMEQSLSSMRVLQLENQPAAPVRHDGMDSPAFSEIFRALRKKLAPSVLLTYLFERGAHLRPIHRTVREIASEVGNNLCSSSVSKAARLLRDWAMIDYRRDSHGKSSFYIYLTNVHKLFDHYGLDKAVLLTAASMPMNGQRRIALSERQRVHNAAALRAEVEAKRLADEAQAIDDARFKVKARNAWNKFMQVNRK